MESFKRYTFKRIVILLVCLGFGFGCQSRYDLESHWVEGEMGEVRLGMTVAEAGGCSTQIVNALSEQLIEEINCLRPNTLRSFTGPNMNLGPAVFPFLQGNGPEDLAAAIESEGQNLQINSALRTLPQQFLLYRWWQQGGCGISLAARPGRSRHESGLAIDISSYSTWIDSLTDNEFSWFGNGDPVHFDYQGGGTTNLAGLSVQAFQRLWNRNKPNDVIVEDGIYGPQTEARILRSPQAGFAISGCEPEPPAPDAALPIDMEVRVDAEIDTGIGPGSDAEASDSEIDSTIMDAEADIIDAQAHDADFDTAGGTFGGHADDGMDLRDSVRLSGGCNQTTPLSPQLSLVCIAFGLMGLRRRRTVQ